MNLVGYAQIFAREQNPALLEVALVSSGSCPVFTDRGESSRIADGRIGSLAWMLWSSETRS